MLYNVQKPIKRAKERKKEGNIFQTKNKINLHKAISVCDWEKKLFTQQRVQMAINMSNEIRRPMKEIKKENFNKDTDNIKQYQTEIIELTHTITD